MSAPRPEDDRGGTLALDTSSDAERLQVRLWRAMAPAEKAGLASGLTKSVYRLALAGIRQRHPGAPDRECFLRLALLTLGPELACRVYPEARALTGS